MFYMHTPVKINAMKNKILTFILIGLFSNLFFAEPTLAQISRIGKPPSVMSTLI